MKWLALLALASVPPQHCNAPLQPEETAAIETSGDAWEGASAPQDAGEDLGAPDAHWPPPGPAGELPGVVAAYMLPSPPAVDDEQPEPTPDE